MQQKGGFAGGRRALEGRRGDADDGGAFLEGRQHVAQRESARDGVELMAALDQPGGVLRMQVGAERHDQDIGLESPMVGHHPPGERIDGLHRRLQEAHAGLEDRAVWVTHVWRHLPSEHHIQFREAEDERVALVDEQDIDCIAESLGEDGCQL